MNAQSQSDQGERTLPQLLLVDDSAAIVAFEAAALSGLYTLATAADGGEALTKIRELRPALVLLDLSMPVLDGDQVVEQIRADHAFDDVAIVIVSTERARAEACLRAGAQAYLPKPLKADELRATVARVLDEVATRRAADSLALLFVQVGNAELALALDHVRAVTLMPRTERLASGPDYLREMLNFRGRPVAVLDLARRLGLAWARPLEDRKLVVVGVDDVSIAVSVDEVREPSLVARADVTDRRAFGGAGHEPLRHTLEAVVKGSHGLVAVLDPKALLSSESLAWLREALARVGEGTAASSPSP
ncbi:MAG: response regulator [Polyangiaceae bacterium]